jgi:hypothetical protein
MTHSKVKKFVATFAVATLATPAIILFVALSIATMLFAFFGPWWLSTYCNNYYYLLLYAPIGGLFCAALDVL